MKQILKTWKKIGTEFRTKHLLKNFKDAKMKNIKTNRFDEKKRNSLKWLVINK